MTHYYNGESLDGSPESVSSQLSKRGMPIEEWATLIHLACRRTWARPCCEGFRGIYESVTEEIDFGKRVLVGYSMLAVTDIAPDGEKEHEWVHIRYCPFCGERLRYELEEDENERLRTHRAPRADRIGGHTRVKQGGAQMNKSWSCPACGEEFYRKYGDDRYWCAMCEHGFEIKDMGSMPLGLDDDLFGGGGAE